jgi:hypothetical protein
LLRAQTKAHRREEEGRLVGEAMAALREKDPSAKRQQKEIKTARKRLKAWKQAQQRSKKERCDIGKNSCAPIGFDL